MMDADSRYQMLYALAQDAAFDVEASERHYDATFADKPIGAFVTKDREIFWLRRQLDTGSVRPQIYRVFADRDAATVGEDALAAFRVRGPVGGLATVDRAEVAEHLQRRGIGTAVYNLIENDLEQVGAHLWPSAPISLSD